MSNSIFYTFEFAIKEGQLENFKTLVKEIVEATEANEPATTNYEFFISDDGSTCHNYERYTDSEAAVKHIVAVMTKFSDRIDALAEPKRATVYGNPSDELRKMLSSMGAVFVKPIAGFAR
ncbi:MAG: antibiotic biosynthesis monooxygenase [Syntrophorhabdales bacterium]|jgi:quinol monooxygenase YgiN